MDHESRSFIAGNLSGEVFFEFLCLMVGSEDLIEAVVSVLETDENFLKMIEELSSLENPSETCMLGKAVLIADPS